MIKFKGHALTRGHIHYSLHDDAAFAFKLLMSFGYAIILHVMKNVMRINDVLC